MIVNVKITAKRGKKSLQLKANKFSEHVLALTLTELLYGEEPVDSIILEKVDADS